VWDDSEPATHTWYQHNFSGAQRKQIPPSTKYVVGADWDADTDVLANTLSFRASTGGSHPGNTYIDGNSANYGVLADYDIAFRLRLVQTLHVSASSITDAGFLNTVSGGDTSPFNAGEKISYTVQSALTNGRTYYWRVRANDGSAASDWSAVRSFTIDDSGLLTAADNAKLAFLEWGPPWEAGLPRESA
jgi:hypothetical protein